MRRAPVDWAEIGRRLQQSSAAAGELDAASDERRQQVLHARVATLARPAPALQETTAADSLEVLVFEVAGERYAVETAWVAQATPLLPVTAIPGVPNHVVGIVAFRGEPLAVLDLRSLLALPLARLAEPAGLVVLQGEAMEFALLAEAIVGVQRYPQASLERCLPGLGERRTSYLLGVAPDRTAILDAEQLLADSTLVVHADQ
jgi:purine-binding chemotaxis protein CheW